LGVRAEELDEFLSGGCRRGWVLAGDQMDR
jgi:hypothetical protein